MPYALFAQCGPAGCPAPQYAAASTTSSIRVPAEVCAAVVQVRVHDGAATSVGSGTYIDPGVVVTNYHVVCDRVNDTVTLTWLGRRETRGQVLGVDELSDLAVIEPDVPDGIAAVPIRVTRPVTGESLAIAGYAGGQFPLCGASARMIGQTRDPRSQTWNFIACAAVSVPGMSGGPILDGTHSLAGVLWGSDGERTIGASCVEVCGLLDRICPGRRQGARRGANSARPSGGRPVTNRPPAVVPGSQVPASQTGDMSKYALKSELAKLQDQLASLETDLTSLENKQQTLGGQLLSDLRGKLQTDVENQLGAALPAAVGPLGDLVKTELGKVKRDLSSLNSGLPAKVENIVGPLIGDAVQSQIGALPKLGGAALATSLGLPIGGGLAAGLGLLGWLLGRKKKADGGASDVTPRGPPPPPAATLGPAPSAPSAPKPAPAPAMPPTPTSAPTQTPVFVQSEVNSASSVALERALETFGAQTPQNARWVNLVYSLRNQLLNTSTS